MWTVIILLEQEDLKLKIRQLLTMGQKNKRLERSKVLLKTMKNSLVKLIVFSDE